jgi:hypothetical protein
MSGLSKSVLQKHLGVSGREWGVYWSDGVTARVADRVAFRCGFHPAEVWPQWMDDGIEEALRSCAARGCSESFPPTHRTHLYCSGRCRNREQSRRYQARKYAADPAFAAAKRAARRRMYEECGEYERARERRRYQANRAAS